MWSRARTTTKAAKSMSEEYYAADGLPPMVDVSAIHAATEPDPVPLTVGTPLIPFPTQALPPVVKSMVDAATESKR
jgi:hypothetical protein